MIVLILAVIGFTAEKAYQNMDDNDSYSDDVPAVNEDYEDYDNDSDFVAKPYTKGEIQGNKYVNEWANISFDITGWTVGDADDFYKDVEYSEYVDCGLHLTDTANNQAINITFTKIPVSENYIDETELMNSCLDGVKNSFDKQNVDYLVSDFYDYVIADETYKNAYVDLYDNSLVEDIYIRAHDGYIIQIIVMADDIYETSEIVDRITPVE